MDFCHGFIQITTIKQTNKRVNMKTQLLRNQRDISRLISFIEAGGPEEHEYEQLTNIWNELEMEKEPSGNGVSTADELARLFGDQFLHETIQGLCYRKPHGYSGDYQVIDFIYQQKINEDKRFQKWDRYFQAQDAARAVRNRKNYFVNLLTSRCSQANRPLHVLNIASGPCRDVLECFRQIPLDSFRMHCVDIDPNAITYAKKILGNFAGLVEFTRDNIFKFSTNQQFDLIWSAGLFDYFKDDDFVKLLKKICGYCAQQGEIIIGNFSVSNPTRAYMEKGVAWYLFHRTPEQLRHLALKAGMQEEQIEVKTEPLGVNLFLHIHVL
jgi:SAM-dependent methyltransferase